MQTVILAGGLGSRLSEETHMIPKPMVTIGSIPIITHIIRWYRGFEIREFVISTGYKSEVIHSYFSREFQKREGVQVTCINTGLNTNTGGRILNLSVNLDDTFLVTYGDGLANVDVSQTILEHSLSQKIGLVTAVRPPARFGALDLDGNVVRSFREKSPNDAGWINGGFFVFKKTILNFIDNENETLEGGALTKLASKNHLIAHRHYGWWHPMDTLRDKKELERLWLSGMAPWCNSSV